MKSSSKSISAAVIAWLRFGKQMPYVVDEFEVGMFRWDVVGANADQVIEVEVKVTMQDLERDLEAKAHKHRKYADAVSAEHYGGVPTRFYFAVPERMKDRALAALKAANPAYGLVVMLDNDTPWNFSAPPWKRLAVFKSAKQLHKAKPSDRLLLNIVKRMSSDIAHWHTSRPYFGELFQHMKDLSSHYCDSRPLETADVEDILEKREAA